MLANRPHNRKTAGPTDENTDETAEVSTAVLLELLGDEYTRTVLGAVVDQPLSGTEVAERTSVSKPTAFRRLNRLADANLVTVRRQIDTENGHHHKVYEARLDTLEVDLDEVLDSFES